jgi:glycosyltransferase involved in cell wall biosynthesis
MKALPLVSIVMPVYNAASTIEAAIYSIINQTYQNWELLILDDGSTDGTPGNVSQFGDKRINYYKSEKRIGVAKRLNEGVLLAGGKYIARMDADDLSFPERIEKQVAFMEAHPETDLLGTSIIAINRSGTFLHEHICPSTHRELTGKLNNGISLYHPTWLGKREWFLKWPYRKCLFKYGGEDFGVLLRSMKSSQFACLEEPLLAYRYIFSLKKMSYNTLLIFISLLTHRYWKDSVFLALKFLPRLAMTFIYLNYRKIKDRYRVDLSNGSK